MTVHHARVIALAVVLVGISALILSPSVRAQQPVSELPLDELRARAEQGDVDAQFNLGELFNIGQEGLLQDFAEGRPMVSPRGRPGPRRRAGEPGMDVSDRAFRAA